MLSPRKIFFPILLLGLVGIGILQARGQLANPSFEVPGSGGAVFGGWDQFGVIGSINTAYHGSVAAKVSGQDTGTVNESGYWQQLACAPGEQWDIGGQLLIPAAAPLAGTSAARIKVEWFGAGGAFINLETFTIADASAPQDQYLPFELLSSPAPAGTEAMRLVLTVLQSPGVPTAEIYYDQITCYSASAPTIDDVQWDDFPSGRILQFSDRAWRVKGSGFYGPGPNNFSHLPQSVWVDAEDRLHLSIKQLGGTWYSTEVTLIDTLGYGDYVFTTLGALDQLDPRAVLGLFLWQYSDVWDPGSAWWNPYNEIDVEYSRWGNPSTELGQFVVQPWDWSGNIVRFDAIIGAAQLASHAFKWLPDRVEFRSWFGGPADESPGSLIFAWDYFGPHIPRPEQPRVHLNLWYVGSPPASDQEVLVSAFTFVAAGGGSPIQDQSWVTSPIALSRNYPNPFSRKTSIRYELSAAGSIRLEVFDVRGRKVAILADGDKQSGTHTLEWDASKFASGVYFCRLRCGSAVISRKLLLIK